MENISSVLNTYAAYTPQEDIRYNSSSGGIFSLLAINIIENGGVVYGVAMTKDMYDAIYKRIDRVSDLIPLRGSKYFQAKIGDTYNNVKEDLQHGITVLFTGTGCQVNGLKCFLQRDYSNLLTVDVLCHGTPSQKIWKMYIDDIERIHGKVLQITFRNKQNGWLDFGMKEEFVKRRSLFIPKDMDSFMRIFLQNYDLRPSCYKCRSKWYKKSDITIADFWGISKILPDMNDKKGTSLIIVRSEAGKKLFDNIKNKLIYKSVNYEDGVRDNPVEYRSVYKPKQRDSFFKDAEKMSYSKLVVLYNVDNELQGTLYSRTKKKIRKWKNCAKILGGVTK